MQNRRNSSAALLTHWSFCLCCIEPSKVIKMHFHEGISVESLQDNNMTPVSMKFSLTKQFNHNQTDNHYFAKVESL